jgi:hypothetical protein
LVRFRVDFDRFEPFDTPDTRERSLRTVKEAALRAD